MSLSQRWLQEAQAVAPGRVVTDPALMEPYGHDESPVGTWQRLPEAVVKPADEAEVAAILRLCGQHGVPLTVRGAGTGLAAGCVPAPGGIVLSMELLNRVIEADPSNRTVTVQAGVTMKRLYEEVDRMSLYFPPHPGDEGAFVGGAAAANAGGSRAVKYGTVRRFVLGLQVVLASGEVLELGGKFIKSSAGYDLLNLMVGSEGTLGVITRVTLGLLPPVGSVQTVVVPFRTVEEAIGAVPAMFASGILPTAVEFVGHEVLRCSERLLNRSWPTHDGSASLMVILDGRNENDTLEQAQAISDRLEKAGAIDVLITDQKARQAEILELRSMLYEAIRPVTVEVFDVCIPRSEIAAHVGFVAGLEKRVGLAIPTYGHAADGNVHSHCLKSPMVDGAFGPEVAGWKEKVHEIEREIYADAVRRKGTISGEHGIGLAKRAFLPLSVGPAHLAAMKAIKKALDPLGILNPGKIFEA